MQCGVLRARRLLYKRSSSGREALPPQCVPTRLIGSALVLRTARPAYTLLTTRNISNAASVQIRLSRLIIVIPDRALDGWLVSPPVVGAGVVITVILLSC